MNGLEHTTCRVTVPSLGSLPFVAGTIAPTLRQEEGNSLLSVHPRAPMHPTAHIPSPLYVGFSAKSAPSEINSSQMNGVQTGASNAAAAYGSNRPQYIRLVAAPQRVVAFRAQTPQHQSPNAEFQATQQTPNVRGRTD